MKGVLVIDETQVVLMQMLNLRGMPAKLKQEHANYFWSYSRTISVGDETGRSGNGGEGMGGMEQRIGNSKLELYFQH